MWAQETVLFFLGVLTAVSILIIATLGLSVIFGIMRVINLAHGEFLMAGAYVALIATRAGFPLMVAALVAGVCVGIFGMIVERVLIRPLYGRLLDSMLVTWGLSLVMVQMAVIIFGPVTAGIGIPLGTASLGSRSLSVYSIVLSAVAIGLLAGVYLLFRRTRYGLLAQATSQHPGMASTLGVDSTRINMLTFGLGSALAGVAGAVLAPLFPPAPTMGLTFVAPAFLNVAVAGPLVVSGTAVAATILGGIDGVVSLLFTEIAGRASLLIVAIVLLRFYQQGLSARWRARL